VAGLLVAGLTLAVVRPDLSLHAPGPGEAHPRPTTVPSGSDLAGITWDARGDLTGDREFVDAAVRRVREERPRVARVLFAGSLPDGSRLLLAGSDVGRGMVATAVHALLVPPGGAVESAVVREATTLTDPQEVLTWAGRASDGHVYAVSMARPGPIRFELSPKVLFGADGVGRRIWTAAVSGDGAVVVDLGRAPDPVIAVRGSGSGVFPVAQLARVQLPGPVLPVTVEGVDSPSYAGPPPDLLVRGLREATSALADLGQARARVLWSGAPWHRRPLALVLVTRPDGVRLQALVGEQDGSAFPAGVRALPSTAPDVVPWLLEPFSPQDPTFLLCPTGAGTLVYRRPGRPAQRLPVRESGAVVVVEPGPAAPSARGAEVTLLDPRGRRLLTTTLPDAGLDDPLALNR
jgi:hypothetical protein